MSLGFFPVIPALLNTTPRLPFCSCNSAEVNSPQVFWLLYYRFSYNSMERVPNAFFLPAMFVKGGSWRCTHLWVTMYSNYPPLSKKTVHGINHYCLGSWVTSYWHVQFAPKLSKRRNALQVRQRKPQVDQTWPNKKLTHKLQKTPPETVRTLIRPHTVESTWPRDHSMSHRRHLPLARLWRHSDGRFCTAIG